MLPAYIIHNSKQTERKDLVASLIQTTGAKVVEAVWNTVDPIWGCRESHKKVARIAKEEHPDLPYLVFEDDCEILDSSFLNLLMLKENKNIDLLYFGINGYCIHIQPFPIKHSWGTHALYITPKVRDTLLEKEELYMLMNFPRKEHPFDQLLCVMAFFEHWSVWKPEEGLINKWVRQKPGLISSISGNIRN
jgi:hypothetical protein